MDTRSQRDATAYKDPGRDEPVELRSVGRLLHIAQGLYALNIDAMDASSDSNAGVSFPCIQLTSPLSSETDPVEILTAWADQGAWLGPEGGPVVVRSPPGGGIVLATVYAAPGLPAPALPPIEVSRLDQPRASRPRSPRVLARHDSMVAPYAREIAPKAGLGEVAIEIALVIDRIGDCMFSGGEWCGTVGDKLRIEAFAIRPHDQISAADVEYKAFGPGGRETRWVSEGKLCGTRGRGIPLMGFAVRLAPHLADRYDVLYEAAFAGSGVTEPVRNGDPCRSSQAGDHPDDYMEAINIRVIERGFSGDVTVPAENPDDDHTTG